jgi:hypothetical protein
VHFIHSFRNKLPADAYVKVEYFRRARPQSPWPPNLARRIGRPMVRKIVVLVGFGMAISLFLKR